jgi:hypothetical protein
MIYDIDDWTRPPHQVTALLRPFQIDTDFEYETRATPSHSPDIDYDFQFWEDRGSGLKLKFWRYRTDEIREARRTVATFPKRNFISKESKNYKVELAKYERALKLIEDLEEND